MAAVAPTTTQNVAGADVMDPISRQILQRTTTQHKIPQYAQQVPSSHTTSGPSDGQPAQSPSDPKPVQRVDSTASSKAGKDKKKGVSFLSRIMGNKKRDDSFDHFDTSSEFSDNRPAGTNAEVFSQPFGYVPKFPTPPKYIRVKTQNRKRREFDRLFLAQIILGSKIGRNRKASFDSRIHDINETPAMPEPPTSKSSKAIWAMEFSKDGKYLAAGGQDKKVRVWEIISTPEERETEEKDTETDSDGGDLKLNAPVFKQKLFKEYDGHTSSILDLSWSKNNFLLSSSMDKTVRLYHVSRDECLCAFKHNDFVTSIQFHPRDDRFFLAGSLDSKIRLWSIPDKSVAYWQQVPDMVTAVAFTPDGKTSIAGCLNGMCVLYDTEGLKPHSQIHVRSARGRNAKGSKITGIDTIALPRENGSSDIKLLITSNDSRVRLYNLRDRNLEIKFRGNENTCSQIHASFSDDGKYVICGSEDRKVYIWPTGPAEKPDSDKRPMEVFEAHTAIVTAAIMAPTATRRLLAESGDPIYDLCNPPPVTLVSRAESIISSQAPTQPSGHSDEKHVVHESSKEVDSPRPAPKSAAYLARGSHIDGQILVTADYTGQIKAFRQDCAYLKRRHDSWDGSSTFSKKMLGRSNSVMTRTSGTSSKRNSMSLSNKNHSTDRILTWRNSIAVNNNSSAANSASDVNLRASLGTAPARSSSPIKSLSQRFPLRRPSTPPSTSPASPTSRERQKQNGLHTPPQIAVQSPDTPDSPSTYHSATERSVSPAHSTQIRHLTSNPTTEDLPHDDEDPLYLVGSQSFMGWDYKHTLAPMAKHEPRTPAFLDPDDNPMSRTQSYVSQLSSEILSSEGDSSGRRPSHSEEELKCKRCGNESFRATMTDTGRRLRCTECGMML